MSTFLVRKHVKNGDKSNSWADTWEEALKRIGKTEKDVYTTVPWLKYIDHFFIGTNDYIREKIE